MGVLVTPSGRKYYYWIYYDRGKRREKYMGTDLKSASEKAKAIGDPLGEVTRSVLLF